MNGNSAQPISLPPDVDRLLRDRTLTAPAKLAYLRLLQAAEWRPAEITITMLWLADECGSAQPRTAAGWCDTLVRRGLLAILGRDERRGIYRVAVYRPCCGDGSIPATADRQLSLDLSTAPANPGSECGAGSIARETRGAGSSARETRGAGSSARETRGAGSSARETPRDLTRSPDTGSDDIVMRHVGCIAGARVIHSSSSASMMMNDVERAKWEKAHQIAAQIAKEILVGKAKDHERVDLLKLAHMVTAGIVPAETLREAIPITRARCHRARDGQRHSAINYLKGILKNKLSWTDYTAFDAIRVPTDMIAAPVDDRRHQPPDPVPPVDTVPQKSLMQMRREYLEAARVASSSGQAAETSPI